MAMLAPLRVMEQRGLFNVDILLKFNTTALENT